MKRRVYLILGLLLAAATIFFPKTSYAYTNAFSWNEDGTVGTATGTVDIKTFGLEWADHKDTVKQLIAEEGAVFVDSRTYASAMRMFANSPTLEEVDFSKADMSGLVDPDGMFYNDTNLRSVTLPAETSKCVTMSATSTYGSMFKYDNALESINLGGSTTHYQCDYPNIVTSSMFASVDEFFAPMITGLTNITMNDAFMPSDFNSSFDYSVTWDAYQNGEYITSVTGSSQFLDYQTNHPGLTTFVKGSEHPVTIGWYDDGIGWRWMVDETHMAIGWWVINDTWYYFDTSSGYMYSGCWAWIGNAWYGFWGSGALCTGWIWDSSYNNYFYCDLWTGAMYQGCWAWIGDAWYGFWADGEMCYGWIWDGAWYYCDWYGGWMYTGWHWIDGAWYYFYENGTMATDTWVWASDGWYWAWSNGVCQWWEY